MLRRPDRTTSVLFLFILANAASLFLFRFFLTLDGPMHVLHACVLKAEWFSHRYDTPQVNYLVNMGTLDITDLVLIPLTSVLSPVMAHTAYTAFVLLLLGSGLLSVAKVAGIRSGALFLWVLPMSCSFVLIMGFLTFLAATGLALLSTAWWMRRQRITWSTLLIMLVLLLICQATHRAGGSLAALFIGSYEAVYFLRDRATWVGRWSGIHRYVRNAGLLAASIALVWKVLATVRQQPRVQVTGEQEFCLGLFHLRPLLLFDSSGERTYLLAIGLLFIVSLALAIAHRLRDRAASIAGDALLLSAIALLISSVALLTPNAQLLYIGTRAQTVALLLLAAWVAVASPGGRTAMVLGGLVFMVHTPRMVHIEQAMAATRAPYEEAMQVVERLPLHGVTLPVVRDDNWMHEHLSAFVAASYQGVFFSPGDHLGFRHHEQESWQLRDYSDGFQEELRWLDDHVARGTPPVIDHVVMFGHGGPVDERIRNISAVLDKYYFLQWQNDYAEVWARDTAR